MEKEIINKIMYDNFLRSVPTMVVDTKVRKTISAYGSINVDDLKSAIDRFDKVPDYGELLTENKKQQEIIDRAVEYIKKEYDDYEEFVYGKSFKVKLLQILEDKEV